MTNLADHPPLSDWAAPSVAAETAGVDGPMLGRSIRRVEDQHLLTGNSTFVANLDLSGALCAHFVTSIHAHARITGIDTTEANAAPGVVDVVTAADAEIGPFPGLPETTPRSVLATDRVRFVGEPVAVVVAETAAQAADAVELVQVDYEPLPAVIDPAAAVASPTHLFDELGTNVVVSATGPGERQPSDFSACEVVVEETFVVPRVAPCPMETRVAASMWTDDGRLVHYASCQGVHPIQNGLAGFYGLEPDQVRVITSDVGGSFGAKARLYPEDILLPLLAKRTGRPVRWVPTRSDDMSGLGHSRAQRQTVKIGGDRDGTIKALDVHLLADLGAYASTAGALARNTGMILPGPFDIDQVHWELTAVVTNTTPIVAYRGAGRPEAGSLLDRAVDRFAAEIGMDAVELRRKNLIPANRMPYENPTGLIYDSGDYHEAFELVVEATGYEGVQAEQAERREAAANGAPGGKLLGVGFSNFIDRTAGIPSSEYGSLELLDDGSFRVITGSSPYGQGHYTTWAMLVSERTGVPVDEIEVVHGDTDIVPRGGITGGSRSAQRAGSALIEATDELVEQARAKAADLLEANVDDVILDVASARFHVTGSPGAATVGWAEIADTAPPATDDYVLKCESDFLGEGPTVPYGAYAAVVEVDTETGEVDLLRLVTVDDAGTIINPMIVFGQIHGALGQGGGQALYEEFHYDADGNAITANFLDYGFPSAAEMPSFECQVTQTPSPNNPTGFKGIAESGCIGAVPAIQNAVIDAVSHLGVRQIDLPLSPQRVWTAIDDATAG
ncbi:MAG: xanthine dehydrogenase family protein molybdopterin-binding subunit [Acidimicrobiia bacterium]|nr:xanthine dehydrogenase family protein molybdopterin-binding subunit [Acidimicrobiia bacterium]